MAIKYRKSDTAEYVITKWLVEILDTNKQYLDFFSEIIKISHDHILDLAAELHKYLGKNRPKNVHETRSYLQRAITKLDLKLVIFKEYAIQYKTLVEEISDLEVTLNSPSQLVKLLTQDIATIEELHFILKNLMKAASVVFKTSKKPSKKLEESFDVYYKSYSRLIKKLVSEFEEILVEQLNIVLLEIEQEVEHVKTSIEEKVTE
ncbi:MAG: hypothetical protein ACTSO7_02150 [Candidatus Heimdallarchaeota archaeon]